MGSFQQAADQIVRQRIAVMEEQIRSGMAVSGGAALSAADGKPLTVPEYRFSNEEIDAMKAELSWLKTKIPFGVTGG